MSIYDGSTQPFQPSGSGGGGSVDQDVNQDETRDNKGDEQRDQEGDSFNLNTTGSIAITEAGADVSGGTGGGGAPSDPAATTVETDPGSGAVIMDQDSTGRVEGQATIVNEGGEAEVLSAQGDISDLTAGTSITRPLSASSESGGSEGSSGSGNGSGGSAAERIIQRIPIGGGPVDIPGSSGAPLVLPGGGQQQGGGLLDTLTSPVGLAATAVTIGALAYAASNRNGGSSSGQ